MPMISSRANRMVPGRAAGFTLIEILVAVLILSVGLLGLAALNLTGLQGSQASYERSVAVMQANDLVERMWAGLCDLYDGDGDFVEAEANTIKGAWEAQQQGTLAGTGWSSPALVYQDAADSVGTVIELTIRWNERTARDGEPATMEFVHNFRLPRVDCST